MYLFLKSIFLFCMFFCFSQMVVAEEGEHEIFNAVISSSSAEKARNILSVDKDAVSARNDHKQTPLHKVYTAEMAQVLLDHGADVHARDKEGRTPLHEAYAVELIQVLLDHGADVHAKDREGRPPALLERLISLNVNASDSLVSEEYHNSFLKDKRYSRDFNRETLQLVLERHESTIVSIIRLVSLLLKNGVRMNRIVSFPSGSHSQYTQLRYIVYFVYEMNKKRNDGLSISDLEIIRQWVKDVLNGVSLDNIKQALEFTRRKEIKNINPADLLKSLDARINEERRNNSDINNIFVAVVANDIKEVERILLKDKNLVDIRNEEGRTPLHYANEHGMVEILLTHGADVHARDKKGKTPLHYANEHGMVEILLTHGADIHARDKKGNTPLHMVGSEGQGLLLKHGAKINEKNNKSETPLYTYIKYGIENSLVEVTTEIVVFLVQNGGRVNVEVSFAEKASNNEVILAFAEEMSKGKQENLSVEDIEAIKQLVINEVGKLKTANILQDLDVRIVEKKQRDAGDNGGGDNCSKSFN